MAKKTTRATATAALVEFTYTTIKPTVVFLRKDGSEAARNDQCLRVFEDASGVTIMVERKGKLLPVESVQGATAWARLDAGNAIALEGRKAQEVAPVATLEKLGLAKKTKPVKEVAPADAKPAKAAAAPKAAPATDEIAALRNEIDEKLATMMAAITALLTKPAA